MTLEIIPGLIDFLKSEKIAFDLKKNSVNITLPNAIDYYKLGIEVGKHITKGTIRVKKLYS